MIVFAINIHSGGGKALLDELLLAKPFGDISVLFCDNRYSPPDPVASLQIHRVKPTLWNRWKAEFKLRKLASKRVDETVLCFGNLPPAFRLKNKTITYLQNAFLAPGANYARGRFRVRMRLFYEKLWSWTFFRHADEFWVQTNSMRNQLEKSGIGHVFLKPILPACPKIEIRKPPRFDFIMVANGNVQKRLEDFLLALSLMADKSISARALVVTDQLTRPQSRLVERLNETSVEVSVRTRLNRVQVFDLYAQSRCLINTSDTESFCLPLYEAQQCGLDVITCDEPYAIEAAPHAVRFTTGKVTELAERLSQKLTTTVRL